MIVLINGVATERLDVADRGLQYGDGVFTTARVHGGAPVLWDRHLARLEHDCRALHIVPPLHTVLDDEARHVCAGVTRGVLKVIVTRGSGGRGYKAPEQPVPTRIVRAYPWPDYSEAWWSAGVRVRVCATRVGSAPSIAGLKHLNRLEQVLARAEWSDPAIAEGLLLNEAGCVVEGVSSNVFAVRGGALYTPDVTRAGVRGVMRELILELARAQGVATYVSDVPWHDIESADELFVTNSVIGLWPVRQLNEKTYPAPGPQTARLVAALQRAQPAYS